MPSLPVLAAAVALLWLVVGALAAAQTRHPTRSFLALYVLSSGILLTASHVQPPQASDLGWIQYAFLQALPPIQAYLLFRFALHRHKEFSQGEATWLAVAHGLLVVWILGAALLLFLRSPLLATQLEAGIETGPGGVWLLEIPYAMSLMLAAGL